MPFPIYREGQVMTFCRLMTARETADYLCLPVHTLLEWARQGRIPSIKLGRHVAFDFADILRFVDKHKGGANFLRVSGTE